jgi:hypothetical protein
MLSMLQTHNVEIRLRALSAFAVIGLVVVTGVPRVAAQAVRATMSPERRCPGVPSR